MSSLHQWDKTMKGKAVQSGSPQNVLFKLSSKCVVWWQVSANIADFIAEMADLDNLRCKLDTRFRVLYHHYKRKIQ